MNYIITFNSEYGLRDFKRTKTYEAAKASFTELGGLKLKFSPSADYEYHAVVVLVGHLMEEDQQK